MNFKGQKRAERIFQLVVTIFAIVGLLVGYFFQSFLISMIFVGSGTALSAIITVPDWDYFNSDPPKWLPPIETTESTTNSTTSSTTTTSKSKKRTNFNI